MNIKDRNCPEGERDRYGDAWCDGGYLGSRSNARLFPQVQFLSRVGVEPLLERAGPSDVPGFFWRTIGDVIGESSELTG